MLLRSAGLRADQDLIELVEARAQYDALTPEEQHEALLKNGYTPEGLEARYESDLELRKRMANKAAQATLAYFQIYKDEIHEEANYMNDLRSTQ